jgi:hypothetical protein
MGLASFRRGLRHAQRGLTEDRAVPHLYYVQQYGPRDLAGGGL